MSHPHHPCVDYVHHRHHHVVIAAAAAVDVVVVVVAVVVAVVVVVLRQSVMLSVWHVPVQLEMYDTSRSHASHQHVVHVCCTPCYTAAAGTTQTCMA